MNKIELRKRLADENLLTVCINKERKQYIDETKILANGSWVNITNVFGVYTEDNDFVIFITDAERGIPEYSRVFRTEEEACNTLYEKVTRLKRIQEKGLA